MDKEKHGTEQMQWSDCDCEEHEQPLNGYGCGFCSCKPTKPKRAVPEKKIGCCQPLTQRKYTKQLRLGPDANIDFQI